MVTVVLLLLLGRVASSPGFSLLPRNNLRMTFDPPGQRSYVDYCAEGGRSLGTRLPERAPPGDSQLLRCLYTSAMLSIVGERERTHLGSIYAHARLLWHGGMSS